MDTKNSATYRTENRMNTSQLSASKIDSPLYQILPGVGSPGRNNRDKDNNSSHSKERSFSQNQQVGPLSAKSTHTSMFQPDSNNSSFVQVI